MNYQLARKLNIRGLFSSFLSLLSLERCFPSKRMLRINCTASFDWSSITVLCYTSRLCQAVRIPIEISRALAKCWQRAPPTKEKDRQKQLICTKLLVVSYRYVELKSKLPAPASSFEHQPFSAEVLRTKEALF